MHPNQLLEEYRGHLSRIEAARELFESASGLVGSISIESAIKDAALSIQQNLNCDKCLPALAKAFVIHECRPGLLAVIKSELVEKPEAEFSAFKKEYAEPLKNYHGIVV